MSGRSTDYFQIPTVDVKATEVVKVIVCDNFESDEEKLSFLALMLSRISSCRGATAGVVGVVISCFIAGVPEMASHVCNLGSVKVQQVNVTRSDLQAIFAGEVASDVGLSASLDTYKVNALAAEVDDESGLYAALASVLMAIGRQAGSGPDASSIKSRPKALIDRFMIPEEGQKLLPGKEYGPDTSALSSINSTFATYTEPRMRLTQYFLGASRNIGHLTKPLEILMTNFRLMRGAGMTHVEAIIRLMRMHPWTVRVPDLTPYYTKFALELKEFEKIEKGVREYHRLLVPQSDFMFLTAEYKPLIAVAGDFIKEVENTFSNYVYNANDYATLIAKVRRYEPSQSSYLGTGTLAAALGVQDMTLPPMREETSRASEHLD